LVRLHMDRSDAVALVGTETDPQNPEIEYGLWFYNQDRHAAYCRHHALRLKYRKKTGEVIGWKLLIYQWRVAQEHDSEQTKRILGLDTPPSAIPVIGEVDTIPTA